MAKSRGLQRDNVSALAHTYGRKVFVVARAVLGDAATAEDVQQEVFLSLLESDPGRVDSWPAFLTTLATRKAIDHLRRRHRWVRLTPAWLDSLVSESGDATGDALAVERARLLRRGLARLRAREAQCFALRFFRSMEIKDISAALDISANHVSVSLHRAVATLNRSVEPGTANHQEEQS